MGGMSDYRVIAVKPNGKAYLVMVRKGQVSTLTTAFTVWKALAARTDGELNARQAAAAVKWVKKKGWKARLTKNPYPFIVKGDTVVLPGDTALMVKLNRIGRDLKRLIHMWSGYRNNYQQWELRMKYLQGSGNLAARCCLRYDRTQHTWAQCGKQSQSNHSQPPKGHAADVGVVFPNGTLNIGDAPKARKLMKKYGLCLPVPGEPWHAQVGNTWNA